MDDATVPLASVPASPLLIVGDVGAAACVGDFCEIPAHHEQIVVNRQLDDDRV
ncbi:MAG: hypothetical protein ACOH1J_05330 [Microbacteriaceae bacterium]